MNKYGISEAKSKVGFKSYAVPNRALGEAKSLRGWLLRGAVFVSAFSLVFSAFVPTVGATQSNKVEICHATSSHSNPYVQNEPNKSGNLNGHDGHNGPVWYSGITESWGDIIPPFSYYEFDYKKWEWVEKQYPGKNWTSEGQAIWNADCEFGKLTLVKVVDGGSAENTDWDLNADGPFDISGETGSSDVTNRVVPKGNYTLSESDGPNNYTASSWTCKDGNKSVTVNENNQVELKKDKSIVCTVTNTYSGPTTGKLTLVKELAGNGQAANTAWTLYANGQSDDTDDFSGTSGVSKDVAPDTYELSESTGPQGYTPGNWNCEETGTDIVVTVDDSEVVVDAGDDITCTIVNTYTPDPNVPLLHFIKVVCQNYSEIVGNNSADQRDDTGGKYTEFKAGSPVKPVSPDEIPKECVRADGWSFLLSTGVENDYEDQVGNLQTVGPTVNGEFVTPISGDGSVLNDALEAGIRNGAFWVSEVEKPGYGFAAIRCYTDALNGDNLEFINIGQDNPEDIYCIAYNVQTEPQEPPCVDGLTWAVKHYDFNQGLRKNNTAVLPERSNPNKALGVAENNDTENFVSLGFGGSIVLSFGGTFVNGVGSDIKLVETSYGAPSDANYPEKVRVEVSMNQAGPWTSLGEFFQDEEIEMGAISQANFIKLTDVSDVNSSKFNGETDGFDVDGVRVNVDCTPPVPEEECEQFDIVDRLTAIIVDKDYVQCSISGYKYDDSDGDKLFSAGDTPLQDWKIYLNENENCFHDGTEPYVYTDENGKYEFTNLDKGTYYVCEKQVSGWNQVLPDPEAHTVVLVDESVTDKNFLNEREKDLCEAKYENGDSDDYSSLVQSVAELVQIPVYDYSVSGCKFLGETDQRLAGWQIYIDLNTDGSYQPGEPTDTTDSNGYYEIQFSSLVDAKPPYHVREVVQNGWEQIYPVDPFYHEVWLGEQQDDATGFHFRNIELPEPCSEPIDLILNGSFENPLVGNEVGWNVFPSGTSGLEWLISWTGLVPDNYDGDAKPDPANIELHGGVNGWLPSVGSQYVELDSDWEGPSGNTSGEPANSSLTQIVDVPTGSVFKLSFDFSPRPGVASNVMEVYWNGNLVATINENGSSNGNTVWQTYSYDVTGIAGDDTLEFREVGNPDSLGSFLDNVKLVGCESDDDGGGDDSSTSGGGSSGSRTDRSGRVLGDSTGLPYQAPQVLGVATELPRTGTPISIAFSLLGLLAIIAIPKLAEVKR